MTTPEPSTVLGRSGLRVGRHCLGTMTFSDESTSREIYATFREAGGTFVDTANIYTGGESERIVGRLVKPERDAMVVATKFTLPADPTDLNSGGSHRKSLRRSVEESLTRLQTEYIDLLWIHAWDRYTPVEETLRALDDLVRAGKVLAIGVSNTPAWVVARSEAIAELRGWTSFCALQVAYSLLERTAERELLPMARSLGLAPLAWSPLARGRLSGRPGRQPVLEVLADIAVKLEQTPAQVALAWIRHHGVLPVLGASSAAQLRDNLGAATVQLGDDHMAALDDATRPELGYPHDFLRDRSPRK
jgi:aryl-alcohol dehydrogenase-like predicted oxidoreductase